MNLRRPILKEQESVNLTRIIRRFFLGFHICCHPSKSLGAKNLSAHCALVIAEIRSKFIDSGIELPHTDCSPLDLGRDEEN